MWVLVTISPVIQGPAFDDFKTLRDPIYIILTTIILAVLLYKLMQDFYPQQKYLPQQASHGRSQAQKLCTPSIGCLGHLGYPGGSRHLIIKVSGLEAHVHMDFGPFFLNS